MAREKIDSVTRTQTLKRLFAYLKDYRGMLVFTLIMTIVSVVADIFTPVLMGNIINTVQTSVTNNQAINFDQVTRMTIVLIIAYVVFVFANIIVSRTLVHLSQNLIKEIREEVSGKIHKIPLSFFDHQSTGDLLSRITNDIDIIGRNVQISVSQIFSSILLLVGIGFMMIYISPILSLIFLLTVPLNFIATRVIVNRSEKYYKAKSRGLGEMVGYIEESFTGTDLIKSYNYQDQADAEFSEYNDKLYQVSYRASFMAGVLNPIMVFIGNLAYVLIATIGGILAIAGQILIGDILAFIQYSQNIRRPIDVLAEMANTFQETIASANRVFEFLDAEEEEESFDHQLGKQVETIEFDHVYFSYEADKPVIQDFNFKVNQGETIAIVGHTGAGKTTLVNLLLRFYEVTSGSIKINGIDISTVPRENLRALFGMVLQDTWLIQGTIYENIQYGNTEASEDQVIQASKEAYAHHFIESLPDGYDTRLKEDATNISQGQRQLITIARAFVSDPEILVLDEATSSVDTRTEQLIQKGMANLLHGRTNFVIAHRLSTIVDADTILVMDKGNIVEQGDHEQLLAKGGIYADLYYSQFVDEE